MGGWVVRGVGNSRCVQGTGLDSGLWSTVAGEVVKSLDSEVTLLFFGITHRSIYWLSPMF